MAQVLVVDDSPTELYVLKNILEKAGHRVTEASNGEDGIAKAKELKPDVILMDVVMPGLNGFQATRKLSKDPETSEIPVIVVSTKDQETDRIWGMRQGAKDYVFKPVNEDELISKIQTALG